MTTLGTSLIASPVTLLVIALIILIAVAIIIERILRTRAMWVKFCSLFITFAVFGVAGLGALEYWYGHEPRPFWYYAVHHVFALIASVGTVGVIVELILKKMLLSEIRREMRLLFQADPEFAEKLNLEQRQELEAIRKQRLAKQYMG